MADETQVAITSINHIPTIPEDRARFLNNKRIMLTYKTHINKDALHNFILNVCGRDSFAFIRSAHEAPDNGSGSNKHPYAHTHTVVDFTQAYSQRNCRIFDWPDTVNGILDPDSGRIVIHPQIQPLKSELHFRNAKAYLGKEDPANSDLLVKDVPLALICWKYDTLPEMLAAMVKKPSDVIGLTALYNSKPEDDDEPEFDLYPWQQTLVDELTNTEGNSRKIMWIVDSQGNSGKTTVAKCCVSRDRKRFYYVNALPNARDGATIIVNALKSGWSGNTLFVNMTRANEDYKGFYDILESVIDGMVTTHKFEGRTHRIKCKRIVVLANWEPKYNKWSPDRYDMRKIAIKNVIAPQKSLLNISPSGGKLDYELIKFTPHNYSQSDTRSPLENMHQLQATNDDLMRQNTLLANKIVSQMQSL